MSFVKDLYSDYDIYNNYLTFFDKSFTSPLSKTGLMCIIMFLRTVHIGKSGATTLCFIQEEKRIDF
jgi:hypothetical protein